MRKIPVEDIVRRVGGTALLPFVMVASLSHAQAPRPMHDVAGTVVDSTGRPVPFAHVQQRGSGRFVVTNAHGAFRLALDSLGEPVIGVRRLGYTPLLRTLSADPDSLGALRLVLAPLPAALEGVRVEAASDYDDRLDREGLYRRMGLATAGGTYFLRRDIERRNPTVLTQLLRDVSGVHVASRGGIRGGRNDVPLGRGGTCALGLVIDGQRVEYDAPTREQLQPRIVSMNSFPPAPDWTQTRPGERFDLQIAPTSIAAVEVYPSATSVPNELQHFVKACGLVVVWTRRE